MLQKMVFRSPQPHTPSSAAVQGHGDLGAGQGQRQPGHASPLTPLPRPPPLPINELSLSCCNDAQTASLQPLHQHT